MDIGELILLGKSDSRDAVLVHGTSLEAIEVMRRTGRLPSSLHYGRSSHPADNGYLFFFPVVKHFFSHRLGKKFRCHYDVFEAEKECSSYAKEKQWTQTLKQVFERAGFTMDYDVDPSAFVEDDELVILDSPLPPEDHFMSYWQKVSQEEKDKIKQLFLDNTGVLVGLNEKIFEHEILLGADEPFHEVMIYLPSGLSLKYVSYIRCLGKKGWKEFL